MRCEYLDNQWGSRGNYTVGSLNLSEETFNVGSCGNLHIGRNVHCDDCGSSPPARHSILESELGSLSVSHDVWLFIVKSADHELVEAVPGDGGRSRQSTFEYLELSGNVREGSDDDISCDTDCRTLGVEGEPDGVRGGRVGEVGDHEARGRHVIKTVDAIHGSRSTVVGESLERAGGKVGAVSVDSCGEDCRENDLDGSAGRNGRVEMGEGESPSLVLQLGDISHWHLV